MYLRPSAAVPVNRVVGGLIPELTPSPSSKTGAYVCDVVVVSDDGLALGGDARQEEDGCGC